MVFAFVRGKWMRQVLYGQAGCDFCVCRPYPLNWYELPSLASVRRVHHLGYRASKQVISCDSSHNLKIHVSQR